MDHYRIEIVFVKVLSIMTDKLKIAKCTPDGRFSVTPDIFEGDYWELELFSTTDDYEYLHLEVKQADYYAQTYDERSALELYRDVLDSTIKNGKVLSKYRDLAKAAYKGLARLASSNDEYIWESCEGLLSYYDDVVNK